ncbi:MAG: hypothetical protein AB8B62_19710 [Roseobacter sp.]
MEDSFIGRSGVTPEAEDRALFKTYGGPIEVEMTPGFQRPNKFLFLAKAFFEKDTEIVAVFSGRRAAETKALSQALSALETAANQHAISKRAAPPKVDAIRLPVQIKGSWQYHVYSDDDGEDIRVFQLVVARWGFKDSRGQLHQFGEAPAFDTTARRRNTSYILQKREIDAVPRVTTHGGANL